MTNIGTMADKLWLKVIKRKLTPDGLFWKARNFVPPSPQHIKTRILETHSLENAIWIETGTYLGDTTLKLSKIAKRVISIEPQAELSAFAKNRLKRCKNVDVINKTSEESIAEILGSIGGPTCFWLDGHHSGDVTFKGEAISPIEYELASIATYLKTNNPIVVFVDDFRLFANSASSGYPSHWSLVDWALENKMTWTVEHDIFISKSR